MNLTSWIFCGVTLVATLLLIGALFPYVAMSEDELAYTKTPIDAELMDDVNVQDFGEVPVLDMVLHYIDNPPLESEQAETKVRFQGC
jgi:hypothetical protein